MMARPGSGCLLLHHVHWDHTKCTICIGFCTSSFWSPKYNRTPHLLWTVCTQFSIFHPVLRNDNLVWISNINHKICTVYLVYSYQPWPKLWVCTDNRNLWGEGYYPPLLHVARLSRLGHLARWGWLNLAEFDLFDLWGILKIWVSFANDTSVGPIWCLGLYLALHWREVWWSIHIYIGTSI